MTLYMPGTPNLMFLQRHDDWPDASWPIGPQLQYHVSTKVKAQPQWAVCETTGDVGVRMRN